MIETSQPVLTLDDAHADLATVGGKGAALARLAAAGLPVPPGFHVTTAAYREFLDAHGLAPRIAEALTGTDEAAARTIQQLITSRPVPEATARAVREAVAALGDVAVAVRSSATAEDLPESSFAGQQESYLNVQGPDAVLDAVRRCWASLWGARAIAYRRAAGVDGTEVAIAVVVQELVDADAAGVLFSANPVTGERGELVVNGSWGLGEAVVGGAVTPDTVTVDRASGRVTGREIRTKTVMTVRTPDGTAERPVPPERRDAAVLTDPLVDELVDLGRRAEALFATPVDVEWALAKGAGGRVAVLQARPITHLPDGPLEVWNDSLGADLLWTSGNVGEAIPSVMTPATWSLVQVFMSETMALPGIGRFAICGNIGGRFYLNLSVIMAVTSALGLTGLARTATEQAFGRLPADVAVPPLPMSRLAMIRGALASALPFLRRVRAYQRRFPELLAAAPRRAADLHERIAAAEEPRELRALWEPEVDRLLRDVSLLLAAGARFDATGLVTLRPRLARLVGEGDVEALLTGLQDDGHALASLGPVLGLGALRRGEIDRETYARLWGHRCPDEFEISAPRPSEDPDWIEALLAGTPDGDRDPRELLRRQSEAHAAAWRRLRREHPLRARFLGRSLARVAVAARHREEARSEVIRTFGVLRAFVRRAGELTGAGDDLFLLRIEDVLDVLDGDRTALAAVPARRRTYEHYRALGPYPTLIRGRFDPDRWAADPERRRDLYDVTTRHEPVAETVTGFAGASGVVEGTVRVLTDVADGAALEPGEILVTTVTNIGWTPLFPRAAAVVTDIGAPLSHAAIVARELGIPAVVGTGNATARLTTGERVRVDGGAGTVTPLAGPTAGAAP